MKPKERWKDVTGFEGSYQASSWGRFKSLERLVIAYNRNGVFRGYNLRKEHILKIGSSPNGYSVISLCKNGKAHWFSAHRLIAIIFIKNPKNLPEVNHKNGRKKNNFYKNLEWSTSSDNQKHAFKMGLQKPLRGETNGSSKLREYEVIEIKELLALKTPQSRIAFEYGVSQGTIAGINQGKTWRHTI